MERDNEENFGVLSYCRIYYLILWSKLLGKGDMWSVELVATKITFKSTIFALFYSTSGLCTHYKPAFYGITFDTPHWSARVQRAHIHWPTGRSLRTNQEQGIL